ncbi:hypothetical protein QR680_014506 [Steinernema hermaphroditum]|uniref:Peptidase S1 domain-containing protein n=1 Tax=Steinernema hermaphroditum TaxID=289476 RepID=A0AA39M4A8_9BILA|nr:hypothetical protein QR680_014506 [Steinernema hermaphroditum]
MDVLPILLCLLGSALALPIDDAVFEVGPSELIIGGFPIKQGQIPMQALAAFVDKKGNTSSCGGTLISKNHVLTAAHCAVNMKDKVMIMVGSVNIQNVTNAQWKKVTKIHVHDQYSKDGNYQNDIAILEFSSPVSLNHNVQLSNVYKNDEEYLKERNALVAGFGTFKYVKSGPEQSRNLLAAHVTLFPFNYCSRAWHFHSLKLKKEEHVCAGGDHRGVAPAYNGGPLYVMKPGRLVQIGITSFGSLLDVIAHGSQESFPAIFTRVSHYCGYIEKTTKGAAKCK